MENQLTPEEQFAAALDKLIGVSKPYCFIRRADKEILAPRSIDMKYNRVVNAIEGLGLGKGAKYRDAAAKAAIASPAMQVVDTICYRPDGPPIINDTLERFNMWTDPGIDPLDGEPTIFLEHIKYLIPNERERKLLLQWLAWIVQHPDQKVMFAVLMVGRGGTGKSWLGKLMERIFGADNVVLLSEESAVTEMFNGFSENKRFVFLHETPPDRMAEILDKIKGVITETTTHIRRLHMERYKADNFANVMAIANKDVKVDRTNRRWAVIRAADDPFAPDHTTGHATYYGALWSVIPPDGSITEELRRVLRYLRTLDVSKFDRLVAPLTGAKEEAAESGDDGGVEAKVYQAYKEQTGPFRFNLMTAEDVAHHTGCANTKTLTTAMVEAGCRKLRTPEGRDAQVTINGRRVRLWAINGAVAAHHTKSSLQELASVYLAERSGKPKVEPMAPDNDNDDWLNEGAA